MKAVPTGDGAVAIEYAGLARGEDPALAVAVEGLQREHQKALDAEGRPAQASTRSSSPGASSPGASAPESTPDDANLPA